MNDTAALGALPTWDLDDLYPGKESTELARDLDQAMADADTFASKYKNCVASLGAEPLGAAIQEAVAMADVLAGWPAELQALAEVARARTWARGG